MAVETLLAASVLAAAWGVVRRGDRLGRQAQAAYPALGQILTVEGRAVHAQVSGSGPDLVLIHGASGNARDFGFDLVARLAGNFRVTAFDRPGLGWSDSLGAAGNTPQAQARVLRAAAGALGLHRPIVLGHSYGGAVALAWALEDPGLAALVLVAAASLPWPGKLTPLYRLADNPLGRRLLPSLLAAFTPERMIRGTIAEIFAPDVPPAGYIDHIGTGLTLRRSALRANVDQVNALRAAVVDMAPLYPRLSLPVELVHGDLDTIVPLAIHSAPLSRLLPNAHLTVIDGVGHMPHHSAPDAVIAAIARAATRAAARAGLP